MAKLIPPVVPAGTMADVEQPSIDAGDGVTLRPWSHSDADTVVAAFSDPDIQHWHFRSYPSPGQAIEWIDECTQKWRSETSATWAIVGSGEIGIVGRVTVSLTLADGIGEVTYWILPEARRRGYATRATRAATRWAHDLGIHRVELQHSIKNEASRRVAESVGFVREGIRRQANLHADGWHDMVLYSHVAGDDPLASPAHL